MADPTTDANDDALADRLEDMTVAASSRHSGGGGRRGGGKGGGKGGGGGRSGGEGGRGRREVDLSRALSRLLRHQAGSAGVEIDREGFAGLERVLQWGPLRALAPTFPEILNAVHNSDKQRFAMKPNPATNPALDESSTDPAHWLIRANQGHSIKLDSEHLLKPLALPSEEEGGDGTLPEGTVPIPPAVIHGTYFAFWPAIVASGGLKPMGRNHVHFSTGLPEDAQAGVISGMRQDAEVLIYVDVAASMREGGIKWWMSDNGVVLTEGGADGLVPLKYFKEVVGRRQEVGLLWKDGEKVADLPEGLKVRAPQGKRGGGGRGGRGRGQKK
ncbi:KptA family-domain-containing protein [Parachaetomium inaequale]|uniref:2'-phosphotransferase n=1 Tax=Parachaetomium inaequale TaxID=2588326 RepID=A0AAN6SV49_9PEZI|nr:KptA family-domain-containing protein [Parachaetomium inaequale]